MHTPRSHDAGEALFDLLRDTFARLGDCGLDEATTIEGYQWLFEMSAAMIEYYTHADPARPQVLPMVTPARRFLGDLRLAKHCYVAKLDSRYTYALRAIPGEAPFLSITVHADEANGFAGNRALGSLNQRDIQLDDDGGFVVHIGPNVSGPNSIVIDETVGSLMTREFFTTESPLRLETRWLIEVIDGPTDPLPPRPTTNDVAYAALLRAAVANLHDALPRYPRPIGQPVFGEAAVNEFAPMFAFRPDAVTTWGNLDAVHSTMAYDIAADEALIIDGGDVVPCAWWGLSQNNRFLASFGRGEPTTIAGANVWHDARGRWRVVLASTDPQVSHRATWLSTAAHTTGVLRIRWLLAETTPALPAVRRVPLAEVARQLA